MVVRKDIDNTSALLTVTVTRDELKPKLDSELKRFRQRVPIKGFRAGQVPMDHVKRLYGTSIFGDTLNDMLAQKLYDYLRESKLDVLGQPLPAEGQSQNFSLKISNPDPEYTLDYEVGFVAPFEVNGLGKSESYERLTVSNLDDLAEEDLKYAQKRMGKRTSPEENILENDMVRIAARELEGDQIKPDGWATNITVLVSSVTDPGLKSQLLAAKKGDTLRFNARNIENHEKEEMYRKYILSLEANDARAVGDWFEGIIEEVNRVEDADLNEEFFQGYFGMGVTNKDEAVDQLKKGIAQFYNVRSNALLMRAFQERLMQQNQLELPEKFLKRWLAVTNENKLSPEAIEQEFPAFAENLRWSMLRDRIKEMFGVEVTEEEVKAEFGRRVRSYFQADLPDNVLESSIERLMQNEKDVEDTRRDLETDRVFEAIRAQVSVTDKAVPSEEFHKILDAVTKKAEAEQSEDAALRASVEE
jgi:trigger factor